MNHDILRPVSQRLEIPLETTDVHRVGDETYLVILSLKAGC
jgi:hypothetical protein